MKTNVFLLTALMLSVAFAGCTDGDGGQDPNSGDPTDPNALQLGKGGVKGLLVDDRYRPIHIVEDEARSEYQTTGFILIQETAEEIITNENGEFTITNLAPGTYTLRVQADGYDAKSVQVLVEAGTFSEITIEARRIVSQGGVVLSQENSMYIPCGYDYVANGGIFPCDLDFSLDGYGAAFSSDYSSYGEEVSFMITEMLANQERGWEIQVRHSDEDIELELDYFAAELNDGDYVRIQLERGVQSEEHQDNPGYDYRYGSWDNLGRYTTIMFVDHPYREEHQSVTPADPTGEGLTPLCCGVGFTMGVKAKFLQSIFLGPPEVDIDEFCVLCE